MKLHVQCQYVKSYAEVLVNGEHLDPGPSQELFNHSPDGFSWGYGGSGPAQLALALLLRGGVLPARAVELHQRFKDEAIAGLPQASCEFDIDPAVWAGSIWASEEGEDDF